MSERGGIRVLIAEDDDAMRRVLADLVTSEPGLELAGAAADATQAIEVAAAERPQVALLDVRMPGSGIHAARGIRRVSPDTAILALSAQEDAETVLQMLEAGATGYLVKGTEIGEIVAAIERAAAGLGSLSPKVAGGVIGEVVGGLTERRRAEEHLRRIRSRVRRALDHQGVLEIVFQPIYLFVSGELQGAEALSRFHLAPEQSPDRWFAEADEAGLRLELELHAVELALESLPLLPDRAFLSVNAKPKTLLSARFHELIEAAGSDRIVVEITEHAAIADYDELNEAVARLRARGARLAIDDAGAGFASLRHILRLDPDYIKLDRSLIDGIGADRKRQALAVGLISFAERIDATIIAEGIEHEDDLTALAALGVDCGQGYCLAWPGPLPLPASRRRNVAGSMP